MKHCLPLIPLGYLLRSSKPLLGRFRENYTTRKHCLIQYLACFPIYANSYGPRSTPENMKPDPQKPKWPEKYSNETKLTPHSNGQWCKKFKGKRYYFGPWSDPGAALERWRAEWKMITSGATDTAVRPGPSKVTVQQAIEAYLATRYAEYENRQLAWVTYREIRDNIFTVGDVLKFKRTFDMVKPHHFDKLTKHISKYAPTTQQKIVRQTIALLKWVNRAYDIQVDVGPNFKGPPQRLIRRQRSQRKEKLITPEDFTRLLDAGDDQAKALLWLGINGGYGNADVSALLTESVHLDGDAPLVEAERHKTGARRIVPLWPETVEALRRVIVPGQSLLFHDQYGKALVRRGTHGICRIFETLQQATGLSVTYYWMRYTFATVAAETGDDHARKLIMGHVIDGVSEGYVLRFPMDRLLRTSNHVRSWLLEPCTQAESD